MLQGFNGKMETTHLIQYDHVERCRGRTSIHVAAHVKAGLIRTPVNHGVDEPAVVVKGKNHWDALCKEGVEGHVVHSVWMIVGHHQRGQIDNVDDSDLDVRDMFLQQPRCRAYLDGRHVSRASQDHIGLTTFVVGRELPGRSSPRTMFKSLDHGQPLQLGLLATGDDVDVVAAPHAMVEDAQEAVAVRRIVDSDSLASAAQCIVDKPGRLVAKSVMVVSPRMTR